MKKLSQHLLQKKDVIDQEIKCEKNNYFGEALKEIRLEKGLTQEQASQLLDITQAMWSAYEVGKSRPDLDTVISIAKLLKISPFALIGRSLDKSKYFDPIYELSFNDYELIEKNVIDKFRKDKITKKLKAL